MATKSICGKLKTLIKEVKKTRISGEILHANG